MKNKSVVVVGAGPAGIISAKTAILRGYDVLVLEKRTGVGGVWNLSNGGMYESAKMQNSRISYHFSGYQLDTQSEFLGCSEVEMYLNNFANSESVVSAVKTNCEVVRILKNDNLWEVTYREHNREITVSADLVTVCTGEHWVPKRNCGINFSRFTGRVITSHEYRRSDIAKGKRVLVIGGGVSGADIASDVTKSAGLVHWSIKSMGLFLPNKIGDCLNDELFSYLGRWIVDQMSREEYLDLLTELDPDYMRMYEDTGLIPQTFRNNAVHVNDYIIRNIHSRAVQLKSPVESVDGLRFTFQCGNTGDYDLVILCTGFEVPQYGYIQGFEHAKLYEHFFYSDDPSLAIISPPIDTQGFGAAFPYFEMIAKWFYNVHEGIAFLPGLPEMQAWCKSHMKDLSARRFYDSWLETIRIGISAREIPEPAENFERYWNIVSSVVDASNLVGDAVKAIPARCDTRLKLTEAKLKILGQLKDETLEKLLASGVISELERSAVNGICKDSEKIPFNLAYRH